MRILIAGETYFPASNGQAIFMVNLAEGLARRDHDVLAVVPSERGDAYQTERNGVRIWAVQSAQWGSVHSGVLVSLFPRKAVRRIFDTFQPDVVHINDHYPLARSVLREARRRGIKTIGTNHFMPENIAPYVRWLSRFEGLFDWIVWRWVLNGYNKLDAATAPSKTAANILIEQGLKVPIYPISCGVSLKRFRPDPSLDRCACRQQFGLKPDATVFVFVGRVDAEKRVDVLLNALHHLDRDDIQLAVAGKGAARDGLEALVRELNLGERVHFLGFVPDADLPKLLNCADIFVMPSEAELLSIATLEAMASGRPILAARARALPELVSEGKNGYLFQPGDARDAAHYMGLLTDERERWAEMGAVSLKRAEWHSISNTVQSYETLYAALVPRSKMPHVSLNLGLFRQARRHVRESVDQEAR
jgi:1,2-diacylglycerol 3-alpha-glucosyltransferase